ncbi:MAG: hypothetical protein RMI04_09590 [Thermofilaceae archaeon]|nr:hypothetical protein [Thermofilaceae archaeon]
MKTKIEKVRRELKELGGLKVEGEGSDYEAAREKLMADLDKLVRTVTTALGKTVTYEEIRLEGDVELTDNKEVKREVFNGYALVKVGKRKGRIFFSGEVSREKGTYTYRGIVSDVGEDQPSSDER